MGPICVWADQCTGFTLCKGQTFVWVHRVYGSALYIVLPYVWVSSIYGSALCMGLQKHEKSPSITTGPNTIQNKVNLVMRIELTRTILMPWLKFSEKFDHLFSNVFIYGNTFPESRFRCYGGYKLYQRYIFQKISILLLKGDEIVRPCDRHINETVTLRKHVTKYINTCENGWSNFSENLRSVALKLFELTRFASPDQSIYFNFVRCWGSVVMTLLN